MNARPLQCSNHPLGILISLFLLLSLVMLFPSEVQAQKAGEILLNEQYRNQPLREFFDSLETKYRLKVFYKEEWVDSIFINRDFNNTPLIQALNNLFVGTDLTFRFFQDDGIVVIPDIPARDSRMFESAQVLLIGNPLNQGRYKEAVLKGRIVDGATGEPLSGAVVYHIRNGEGAASDRNGVFELKLPTGDHQLRFSYIGFEEAVWNIRLIEDGGEDFSLFEDSHNIEEVVVVGREAAMSKAQMSIVEMSALEIKKVPALMGEVDVLKSVTLMPGVQSVGELSSGFNVRGGNTDQNLILINGSPVFNSSHLFGFLSLINPDVVSDVRLFKGGTPARHGERVASVMEVGIKDGNEEDVRFYGGIGLINSRLAMDGPITRSKKLTFVVGGRSSYANWILQEVPELNLARSVTHFYDLSGKLTYRFDAHNRIAIMGYSSNDEFSTSSQSVTRYGNLLGNLKVNVRLADQLYADLEASHSEYAYRLTDYANNNPPDAYHLDNHLAYSSAGTVLRWHPEARHDVIAGFKGISYGIKPGRITPVEEVSRISRSILDHEQAVEWAVFAEDEFEASPRFTLSAGIRYSNFLNMGPSRVYLYSEGFPKLPENVTDSLHFGSNEVVKKFSGFEPRFAARFDINPSTALKLSYQRIHQYLFQLSNSAVISPAETWKAAGYHLDPLINDQVVAGLENDSWLKGIKLSAEVYYKNLQNLIEYKNGAQLIMNNQIETSLVPADGYSYGMELSVDKNTGRLSGSASYVFSRTMRQTTTPFIGDRLHNGAYYPSIYDKPHDVSALLNYDISRRWRLSANMVYISGRPVTLPEIKYLFGGETLIWYSDRNKYRMPPYHRVDVSITFDENLKRKRMWKGSWTLSVYNLYGRRNPYSVYYRKATPGISNDFRRYSLYKLAVIGIPVPSLTYNFKF